MRHFMNKSYQATRRTIAFKLAGFATILMVYFAVGTVPALAQGNAQIEALKLDGRVINIYHPVHKAYLGQGSQGTTDLNRNAEAVPNISTQPPRNKGYDWVLQDVGGGYYYIINVTTGLYLTKVGNAAHNVAIWGNAPEEVEGQKWAFYNPTREQTVSNDRAAPGTYGTFKLLNKLSNHFLSVTDYGQNPSQHGVVTYPEPKRNAPGYDWVIMPALETDYEREMLGRYDSQYSLRSSSLASLRRLTIERARAISVSTGMDAGTSVLFTAIDLAVDVGLGVGTGGASVATTTAARTVAKTGGRAITKSTLKAAAKAGAKAGRKKVADATTKKALATAYAKNVGKHIAGEVTPDDIPPASAEAIAAEIGEEMLDLMSSEAMFKKIYGDSPDDLYIRVNGSSIFPNGGGDTTYHKVNPGDEFAINKSFVFERFRGLDIELMDHDDPSANDSLGNTLWHPYYDEAEGAFYEFEDISALYEGRGRIPDADYRNLLSLTAGGKLIVNGVERYEDVLIAHSGEGSLYEITYRVEPFVPAHMVLGKADSANLKKKLDAYVKIDHAAIALKEAQDIADAANAAEEERWRANSLNLHNTCSQRGRVKSVERPGESATRINMSNSGSKSINVYWINMQGEEVNYASQNAPIQTIASGPYAVEEHGSPGYWYIAVDDNGECVGLGSAAKFENVFRYNPDLVVPGEHPLRADLEAARNAEIARTKSNRSQHEIDLEAAREQAKMTRVFSQNCSLRGAYKSQENQDEVPTQFTVYNGSKIGYGMHLYWVDTDGQEVNYRSENKSLVTVPAGDEGVTISGKPGYWYAAYDNEGHCVGLGNLKADRKDLFFDPELINPELYTKRERPIASDTEPTHAAAMATKTAKPAPPAATSSAAGPGCEYMGQVKSTNEGNIIDVRFENHTNSTVNLYWIDGNGAANNYPNDGGTVASIPAQSFQAVRTKVGHIFIGYTPNGTCLGMAVAEASGKTIAYSPLQ